MARPLKGWKRTFADPITVSDGSELLTLEDAATYIQKLANSEQSRDHWQTAVEMLIRGAEREAAWVLFAQMAIMKALNHGRPAPAAAPRRKPAKRYNIVPAVSRET